MRLSCVMLLCSLLLGVGCSTPPPISPGTLAKERARQDVDRLNARIVLAYQKRQETLTRVQDLQTRLRHPGLSPKERAGYQVDLDEANRQVTDVSEHVAELEEELRQEWDVYRTLYGTRPRLAGPLHR
ncbi:MAG: hypothetical protein ABI945_05435 [Nitrospirales bacterium]